MPWFKVDDSFAQHPKVLAIPRRDRAAAIGLWTLAGTWCASQLTDGRLARGLLAEFACTPRQAQVLVEVGLWETTEDGYQFHDWATWQPTKAQVEGERAAAKERMQRVREARRQPPRSPEPPPNDDRTSGEVRLTPSRPVPSSTSKEVLGAAEPRPPKRATQIPDDFEVTENMRVWATANRIGLNLDRETAKFRDHHTAKGSTFKNWEAAWHTWMRKADEYANVRQLPLTASGKEYQPWNP